MVPCPVYNITPFACVVREKLANICVIFANWATDII